MTGGTKQKKKGKSKLVWEREGEEESFFQKKVTKRKEIQGKKEGRKGPRWGEKRGAAHLPLQ